jgi:two-component system nitrogen regulation sensor histidine kinase NtrY
MPGPEIIQISLADSRERKRRRRELLLAGVLFIVVVALSLVEIKYLGANFSLFLVFFNLNFIFLIIVLVLVVRNTVKLILERRRKVLGSRLRSRLVLAFVLLSLVPSVMMYLMSVQFVQTSVDYWFKSQVESSMEQALDVGQAFYEVVRERLGKRAAELASRIESGKYQWPSPRLDAYLESKYKEYDLVMLGALNPDLSDAHWHWTDRFAHAWGEMKPRVDWSELRKEPKFWSMWWPGAGSDFVVGVMPVNEGKNGYLVLSERIGSGLLYKLDQIVRGVDEYKRLKTLKAPLKAALFFLMGLLTLLIVFGAMWFGFRLSKELTAPIQALAMGTEHIARGDLSVRLEDDSSDELGVLVRSFNRMAEDLEQGQSKLTEANKQLEDQYQELEQRGRYIEAILDNTAAGVVSLDSSGAVSTVNKAAAEIFGLDGKLFIGRRAKELLRGEFADLLEEVESRLGQTPETSWKRQLDVRIGNQDLKLLTSVVALTGSDGQPAGLVAVFEDVTELEKMQRMAAWREVARRIAHEIKNPLTPIKLSAQRLERKFGPELEDPAFAQCTGLIVRQVEHLQQMVSEFSAFAKLPESVLEPGYLAPLLEEVVALFQHSHSNIAWSLTFKNPIPRMRFDHEGLRRGFMNILTNAVEALENVDAPEVQVTAQYEQRSGHVRVEVRDNGPGLSPEERNRIFEPYYSRKKGGAGLGMSILKSIVSDHRGYVRAYPAPNRGAIISVEIPVA